MNVRPRGAAAVAGAAQAAARPSLWGRAASWAGAALTPTPAWLLRGAGALAAWKWPGAVKGYGDWAHTRYKQRSWLGAKAIQAADALGWKACFGAGTPLLWEHGSKAIEQFQPGERVWSRNEFDPRGPLALKVVEEVFVRLGRILHLHVGGQVIKTTPEHPFGVEGKGWVAAGGLRFGNGLSG